MTLVTTEQKLSLLLTSAKPWPTARKIGRVCKYMLVDDGKREVEAQNPWEDSWIFYTIVQPGEFGRLYVSSGETEAEWTIAHSFMASREELRFLDSIAKCDEADGSAYSQPL